MEKFFIILLVIFALLLYATTVHVQDTFDDPLIKENTNLEF